MREKNPPRPLATPPVEGIRIRAKRSTRVKISAPPHSEIPSLGGVREAGGGYPLLGGVPDLSAVAPVKAEGRGGLPSLVPGARECVTMPREGATLNP